MLKSRHTIRVATCFTVRQRDTICQNKPSVLCIAVFRYRSKYKKVGVLPIQKVKFNVSSVGPSSSLVHTSGISIRQNKECSDTCDIQSDISTSIRTQSKHKPRAEQNRTEQKTKQRKIIVVLYLQVPEDKSCFVLVSILCLCLCRQCEPGFRDKRMASARTVRLSIFLSISAVQQLYIFRIFSKSTKQ